MTKLTVDVGVRLLAVFAGLVAKDLPAHAEPAVIKPPSGREYVYKMSGGLARTLEVYFPPDHDGFGGIQPYRVVTDGRFKLCVNLLTSDELYDLREDPHECANRINDTGLAAERDRLHDALLAWMNDTRDPLRGYYWSCRTWRADVPPPCWSDGSYTRQRITEPPEPPQLDYETGLPFMQAVRKK